MKMGIDIGSTTVKLVLLDDENEIVYIVRIMYRGRDVRKQLSRTEDISEN